MTDPKQMQPAPRRKPSMNLARTGDEVFQSVLACLVDEALAPEERFDLVDYLMSELPEVAAEQASIFHRIAGGMYVREMFHAAGTFLTSVTHLFEHPFFLIKGEIAVYWIEGAKVFSNTFRAPTYTITAPETRRFVFAIQDTTVVTVHRTDEIDPDRAIESLISDRKNPLLPEGFVPAWKTLNASSPCPAR